MNLDSVGNIKSIVSKGNTEGQLMVRMPSGLMGEGFMEEAGTNTRLKE